MNAIIYDYTCTNILGSVSVTSLVENRTLNTYRTATMNITPQDYVNNKSILKIGNVVTYATNANPASNTRFFFRIASFTLQKTSVVFSLEQLQASYSLMNTTTWAYPEDTAWTPQTLVSALTSALNGTNDSWVIDNTIVIPDAYRHLQSRYSTGTTFDSITGFNFIGKNVIDIIETIRDTWGIFTTFAITAVWFSNDPELVIGNPELDRFRTNFNATDFTLKEDSSTFRAALLPVFNYEVNDRWEKKTDTMTGTIHYNTWYNVTEGHTQDECKRRMICDKLSPTTTWDRRIRFQINLYNPFVYSATQHVFDYTDMSLPGDNTKICNVLGTEIAYANISAIGTTNIIEDGTSTVIGTVTVTQGSSESKYNIRILINSQKFGVHSSSYGDVDFYYDNIKEEVKTYSPLKKYLGTANISGTIESLDPSTNFFNLINEEEGAEVYRPGTCHVSFTQHYVAGYLTNLNAEVNKLAQIYIDSYLEEDLYSVSFRPITGYGTGLGCGMRIRISDTIYERDFDLIVVSVDYDVLADTYSNLQVGFKRKTLRDLKK